MTEENEMARSAEEIQAEAEAKAAELSEEVETEGDSENSLEDVVREKAEETLESFGQKAMDFLKGLISK